MRARVRNHRSCRPKDARSRHAATTVAVPLQDLPANKMADIHPEALSPWHKHTMPS